MKTIVTIFAVLFLVFAFIIFILLFKLSAEKKTGEIESGASSITTELLLKNFLREPAPEIQQNPVKELSPDVGEDVTNANLISWTCNNNKKENNYKALKASIEAFFDDVYGDDWELWIIYANPEVKRRGFGHKSLLEKVWKSMKDAVIIWRATSSQPASGISLAFLAINREKGFASQIIPCSDKLLAKVMLKSSRDTNIKNLKTPT